MTPQRITPQIPRTKFYLPIFSPMYYNIITDRIVSNSIVNKYDNKPKEPSQKSMTFIIASKLAQYNYQIVRAQKPTAEGRRRIWDAILAKETKLFRGLTQYGGGGIVVIDPLAIWETRMPRHIAL